MSNRISILLQRNLDVFGENDPARRRALIDEYYTEDCVFYDPNNGTPCIIARKIGQLFTHRVGKRDIRTKAKRPSSTGATRCRGDRR